MFQNLSDKLSSAFRNLRGKTVLSAQDLEITLKEVRLALLEADVNYKVAKDFCAEIATLAQGEEVLKSLKPDQQIIKIVHEQLKNVLGANAAEINLKVAPPAIIMMVGLQGAGKTTSCGKLAIYLRKQLKRNPLLVPADIYRPAAVEQLKTLGKQIGVTVYDTQPGQLPLEIASKAVEQARLTGHDVVILDTAGRLQIDAQMMGELKSIQEQLVPQEILLVADAMTGQEAVNVAQGFSEQLNLSGLILTKMDGDARGGAALSMLKVTGKPIKFIGLGEKLDALEVFHPDRLASRILGMGDVLSLIEKASEQISMEDSLKLQKKIQKNDLDLNDFLNQMRMMNRMGSISSLMSMIPGMDKLTKKIDPEQAAKEMQRVEAIILSMTLKERSNPDIINGSRRKRISKGSGTQVSDVNQLLKQFLEVKKMMKQFNKMGMGNMMKALGGKNPLNMMKGF